jgi:nucleotide-binding universal stress UspA family protein
MDVKTDRFPATLVLATDGSNNTAQATRAAIDIARSRGSKVHLVHVWHDVRTSYAHAFVKGDPAEVLLEAAREGERPTLVAVGSVSTRVIRAGPGAILVYAPAGDR